MCRDCAMADFQACAICGDHVWEIQTYDADREENDPDSDGWDYEFEFEFGSVVCCSQEHLDQYRSNG